MELEIFIKMFMPGSAQTFGGGAMQCLGFAAPAWEPQAPGTQLSLSVPRWTPKKHFPHCPQHREKMLVTTLSFVQAVTDRPESRQSSPQPRHFLSASASHRSCLRGLCMVLLKIFMELDLFLSLPSLCCLFPFIVFKNPELPPPSIPLRVPSPAPRS